ncbi:PHD finger protein 7-like [Tyto alba]|uniref:PHD finger protein 7-like n=1 Tax=Tyto alba TaxID=56313 RepID=UPI001C667A53|nr:PHD finger protein 7-like [Tyto alba]
MSARKQKAADLMEPACMLCGRAEADPDIYGYRLQDLQGLCAHHFCLYFANGLFQQRVKNVGLMGFLLEDICHTVERAAQQRCFVCGESGAAITCCQEGCDRSFHLPCAVEGECVTQFCTQYRSFCWQHRPEQAVEAAPGENTPCLICLDPVEDRKSYGTMVCPACKHAWFHRACIQVGALPSPTGGARRAPSSTMASCLLLMFPLQGQAARAGICFQCPLCRDGCAFLLEMLTMGIRVPFRSPAWDNEPADAAPNERHSRCDARECLCPGGRQHAEEQGPWQLLLCCSCAAEGTHRCCSHLGTGAAIWECDSCAGLGTASSGSSEVAGPITESQSGSGPSHSSPAPETSSPRTGSTAALGSSCRSAAGETSSPSSTGHQAASGPSQSSPVPEGSSCPRLSGPDRVRDRSRLLRRAQKPYSRPTRGRGRSRAPAPRAESSSPAQLVPGFSRGSPVPETGSPSTASQLPAGSSPSSARLQSSRRPSRPGPVRARDRARLRRRAQSPYSRPGR